MMNKKALLALGLLVGLGLGACTPETPAESSSEDTPTAGADWVAELEAEGKMYIYLKLGEDGISSLSDWTGIWVTGSFAGWDQQAKAVQLLPVTGHDGYYGASIEWSYDPEAYEGTEEPTGYNVTLGYTKAAYEAQYGVNWSYKSVECNAVAYPNNPTYTVAESGLSIDLGTHTFASDIAQPVILENYIMRFEIATELPDYVKIGIAGSMNGWKSDVTTEGGVDYLTKVEGDNNYYDYIIPEIVKGSTVEYKLVALTSASTGFWTNEGTYTGIRVEEDKEGVENTSNPIYQIIGNDDYTYRQIKDWSFESLPADPDTAPVSVAIDVTVTDIASMTGFVKMGIKGSWNWDVTTDMTATEGDVTKWSVKLDLVPGDYQFGFVAMDTAGAQISGEATTDGWISGADGNNIAFTAAAGATLSYTGTIAGVSLVTAAA